MRVAALIPLLVIAGAGVLFGLNRSTNRQIEPVSESDSFRGATMGTTYSVKVAGMVPAIDREQVATEIQAVVDRVNACMSTYDPNSELSRFNRSESTDWFPVTNETARVVAEAIRVAQLSDGALDVTVGPVVDLWSFGPEARPEGVLPTQEEIANALAKVGFANLEVRLDPPALRKAVPTCRVDLSSLAKGFGVDQVAGRLEELGINRYMVEVGGEIRTAGENGQGRPWQIAVEVPTTAGRGIQRVVELKDQAMATSGDYRNYFEQDGVRFCHIIDPRTGRPVDHRLASVSVLAKNCMEADALATALFVLGPEEGLRLASAHNIAALFLVRTDRGFTEQPSPSFASYQP